MRERETKVGVCIRRENVTPSISSREYVLLLHMSISCSVDAETKSVVAAAGRGPAVTVGLQYFLSKFFFINK